MTTNYPGTCSERTMSCGQHGCVTPMSYFRATVLS
ncbi:MAG: hypothetical protein HW397_491, partial [Dehalococcoidia bacterium]|nr:hypothetical protein [Dehalococcoidia bacterium]